MVQRLIGKDALSAAQLSRETGVRQQSLSRWLEEARSLPRVAEHPPSRQPWSLERKAQILAEASKLTGCVALLHRWMSVALSKRSRSSMELGVTTVRTDGDANTWMVRSTTAAWFWSVVLNPASTSGVRASATLRAEATSKLVGTSHMALEQTR
jgi:hypothetical protein